MNRYERAYGTDWATLGKGEAVERAYALGVAAELDECHPGELDALRDEMDTAYDTSVVDLAFEEGRKEVRAIDFSPEHEDETIWSDLVEDETVSLAEESPAGGPPDAIEGVGALDPLDLDSTDVVRLPEFLDRD